MSGPAVLVFVRAPVRGRVKTRLARGIGDDAALALYREMGAHAVGQASAAGLPLFIHYTPADGLRPVADWLGPDHDYRAQADGDLGVRMQAAFEAAFREGYAPVVIVGSDLPGLRADHLRDAVARLVDHEVVLGPAHDGGYWLLGLSRPRPELFRDMEWSTRGVLAETLRRLRAARVEPALLETLADVDEVGDLPLGCRPAG